MTHKYHSGKQIPLYFSIITLHPDIVKKMFQNNEQNMK